MPKSTLVSRSARFAKATFASVTVIGFLGVAAASPFSAASAAEDAEAYAQFQERIHQQFIPEAADPAEIDLAVSPIERLPDPKPEPTPEPEESTVQEPAPVLEAAAPSPPQYSGGGSPAEWMAAAGIAESDWGYVDYIASRESGWNPNATNPSSGACGLIQALPCSKVPGSGYDPVDNLRWANGYAVGRYGSWKAAYDFWTANHWW